MIKKVILFSMLLVLISACKKESTDPIVNVQVTLTKSDNYESAILNINEFFLFDGGKANIQNWDEGSWTYLLESNDMTVDYQNTTHWEMDLEGAKPYIKQFLISTDAQDDVYRVVTVDYIEQIKLDNLVSITNNNSFNIEVIIHTDEAIVEEDDRLKLDWNFVDVVVTEL